MTRAQKIEELCKQFRDEPENEFVFKWIAFKVGILAGIALRDEELLAMEFDEYLAFEKSKEWANTTTQSAY